MKHLVTGASGFIGSHLVHTLAAQGHEVRALVRSSSSRENLHEDDRRDFDVVSGTLDSAAALADAMRDVEIVHHVAGATAAFDREAFDRTNVTGTKNVLAAAEKAAVRRVVLVSSLMAAGPSHPSVARREHHRLQEGFSIYGDSKLAAERVGWDAAQRGALEVVIVRPPLVYGPRDRDVLQMIKSAKLGVVAIAGFHQQWMSMIHVQDLVNGIALAGTRGAPLPRDGAHVLSGHGRPHDDVPEDPAHPEGRGIYYFTDGEPNTVGGFGRLSAEILGSRAVSLRLPRAAVVSVGWATQTIGRLRGRVPALTLDKARASLSPGWWCDDARARHEFGFTSDFDLRTGLVDTIAWLEKRGWL